MDMPLGTNFVELTLADSERSKVYVNPQHVAYFRGHKMSDGTEGTELTFADNIPTPYGLYSSQIDCRSFVVREPPQSVDEKFYW